jgi:hypothetical protein
VSGGIPRKSRFGCRQLAGAAVAHRSRRRVTGTVHCSRSLAQHDVLLATPPPSTAVPVACGCLQPHARVSHGVSRARWVLDVGSLSHRRRCTQVRIAIVPSSQARLAMLAHASAGAACRLRACQVVHWPRPGWPVGDTRRDLCMQRASAALISSEVSGYCMSVRARGSSHGSHEASDINLPVRVELLRSFPSVEAPTGSAAVHGRVTRTGTFLSPSTCLLATATLI